MNVKEWLERGFNLNIEIQQLKQAKDAAKELCESCGEDVPSYREYAKELFRQIDKLLLISREIAQAVSKVDNPLYRTILTARYINFKTWEEIADDLEFNLRWIYRLRKRIMAEVEEIIVDDGKLMADCK